MSRRRCNNSTVDFEALDIARGLYDSKINIKRPPSEAQRGVYTGVSRGPPLQVTTGKRPFSAKGRITTEKVGNKTASPSAVRPPWRPFSGHATVNRPTPSLSKPSRRDSDLDHDRGTDDKRNISDVPTVYHERHLPRSLSALQEWLTDEIPNDWATGYNPKCSFVFLPCIQSGECVIDTLPCVPCVQQAKDLLLHAPFPEVKKYKPPKPRYRRFLEGDDKDNTHSDRIKTIPKARQSETSAEASAPFKDIYDGKRRADIIRQEIEDLERLLLGIGNPRGSSIVVRYQHDINSLRDMVKTTLEGCEFPEEDRCLTPIAASLQEDLVRFPERHDEIMISIKQRRDECVKELADIEQEIMRGNKCS